MEDKNAVFRFISRVEPRRGNECGATPKLSPAEQEVLDISLARRDAPNKRDIVTLASC